MAVQHVYEHLLVVSTYVVIQEDSWQMMTTECRRCCHFDTVLNILWVKFLKHRNCSHKKINVHASQKMKVMQSHGKLPPFLLR